MSGRHFKGILTILILQILKKEQLRPREIETLTPKHTASELQLELEFRFF